LSETTINSLVGLTAATDSEFALLERVKAASSAEERLTQRELARASGLSLGMTNILVRRLVGRGWLALRRHSAKSISYLLTPEGVAEVARRSGGYFERAARIVTAKSDQIEAFIVSAKFNGARTLVLVGSSAADFIIERLCDTHKLVFIKSADAERWLATQKPDLAVVWGERAVSGVRPPRDNRMHFNLASQDEGGFVER